MFTLRWQMEKRSELLLNGSCTHEPLYLVSSR